MSTNTKDIREYDNYAIDRDKLSNKPKPKEEVMRDLRERISKVQKEFKQKETA